MTPDEIERLRSRVEREQRARRQAEQIAERGMRELWEANQELQRRVSQRTAQLERASVALVLATQRWSSEIAAAADQLRSEDATVRDAAAARLAALVGTATMSPARTALPATPATTVEIADEILARWQRPLVRSGQLLTTSADHGAREVTARWEVVAAIVDVVLNAVAGHGPSGPVSVDLAAAGSTVCVTVRHPLLDIPDGVDTAELGPIGAAIDLAEQLVTDAGGALRRSSRSGGLVVDASVPADVEADGR